MKLLPRFAGTFLTGLSLLTPAVCVAESIQYIALTDDDRVEMFASDGSFLESRSLGGPALSNGARVGLAYGDLMSDNAGNELVVLRDTFDSTNTTVELYQDPTATSGSLDRLRFVSLETPANREVISIDVANYVPENDHAELVTLARDPSLAPQSPFLHVYGQVTGDDGSTVLRLPSGYVSLSASSHEPLARAAVGELDLRDEHLEIVTLAENGYGEVFRTLDPTGGPSNRLDYFTTGGGMDPVAVKVHDRVVHVLGHPDEDDLDERYRIDRFLSPDVDGDVNANGTIRLQANPSGQSTFVDIMVIPEPASLGILGLGLGLLGAGRPRRW